MGLLQWRRDDVSEQMLTEVSELRTELEHVRRELALARAAMAALPVGVILADGHGTVLTKNEMAARLTASDHGGLLVRQAVDRHLADARNGRRGGSEVDLFGPPRRVIDVRATQLSDGSVLVLLEDISERSRLDAVRTDFVANISHELKTPVGAIAVLAEALVDEDDPEVISRVAAKMAAEAHRAATSIDDLLELARIELGGESVADRVEVNDVLHDAVMRSLAGAEHRDIRIEVDEAPPSLAVRGDRRQLVSAIANLIDNAVKYSDPASTVTVAARRSVHPHGGHDGGQDGGERAMVELLVSDTGIGIPARDLERIFERFYRVDRARSRQTGGIGLGLAIVRHVANNHAGEVTVSSVEGEGSTFILRIPEVV